jgi:integrase
VRSTTARIVVFEIDNSPQKVRRLQTGGIFMGNPRTARDPSTIVNRTVTPRRPRNADLREREYLTPKEVDRLQDAARKHSRYGHRDAAAILIAYRHGLRASELCELTWNMIELDSGRIHVRRAKNGVDSTHPLDSPG